MIVERETLLK
ncbi:hypothetical protein DMN91_007438, partial [Ooceraea biroi]